MLKIPAALARQHGAENAATIGAQWAETLELHGGLTETKAVLDIGCGPGRIAIGIGERFGFRNPLYLGFDVTRPEIEWCSANITAQHPQFRFVHLDVYNGHYNSAGTLNPSEVRFPAEDHAFDFVFATSVFTHLRTADMLHYLSEARRCLRHGGTFLASFACIEDHYVGKFRKVRSRIWNDGVWLDEHCFTCRPRDPETWTGYRTSFVLESFKKLGFTTKFYRGGWAGIDVRTGRHGQDYVVATG